MGEEHALCYLSVAWQREIHCGKLLYSSMAEENTLWQEGVISSMAEENTLWYD